MTRWLAPLVATLVIEVPLVAALFAGQRAKMALVAVAVNVATNLILNLVVARSSSLGGYQVPAGELFGVIVEAGAYGLATPTRLGEGRPGRQSGQCVELRRWIHRCAGVDAVAPLTRYSAPFCRRATLHAANRCVRY